MDIERFKEIFNEEYHQLNSYNNLIRNIFEGFPKLNDRMNSEQKYREKNYKKLIKRFSVNAAYEFMDSFIRSFSSLPFTGNSFGNDFMGNVLINQKDDIEESQRLFREHFYSETCVEIPSKRIALPCDLDVSKVTSLEYALRFFSYHDLKSICDNWNTSHIRSFKGCFSGAYISTFLTVDLNYSSGTDFSYMFYGSYDDDDYRWVGNMDCSNGLDYSYMFNVGNCDNKGRNYACNIDFKEISRIKINPNGNFKGFFKCLPIREAEYFRRWFPDEDLYKIQDKIAEEWRC